VVPRAVPDRTEPGGVENGSRQEAGAAGVPGDLGNKEAQERTLAEIREFSKELEARIREMELAREVETKGKLATHDELLREAQENNPRLLDAARSELERLEILAERGVLSRPEDQAQLERARQLVADVEKRQQMIDQKITELLADPALNVRLYEEAKKQDKTIELESITKKELPKLETEVGVLPGDITNAEREISWRRADFSGKEKAVQEAGRAVYDLGTHMVESLSVLQTDESYKLRRVMQEGDSWEERITKILAIRGRMGVFRGKEKAAVDELLVKAPPLLTAFREKEAELARMREDVRKVREELSAGISAKYADLLFRAYLIDERVGGLQFWIGTRQRVRDTLRKAMDQIAARRVSGRGRDEPWRATENEILYQIFHDVLDQSSQRVDEKIQQEQERKKGEQVAKPATP